MVRLLGFGNVGGHRPLRKLRDLSRALGLAREDRTGLDHDTSGPC
jgi:hypothetical protein